MSQQLFRFAIVWTIGFLVDTGILYLALSINAGYFIGRIISFLCAVGTTWYINRSFTFCVVAKQSIWREWWRYLAAMLGGGIINYFAYTVTVIKLNNGSVYLPLYAVAIGSLMGMSFNFVTAKCWVFK